MSEPKAESRTQEDFLAPLQDVDPELAALVSDELARQRQTVELIASENFTSRAVLEAAGTILTNKYAEGYPHARYYGGCEVVDEVETLAIQRCKSLFGAEHVNVQPHSGSSANQAVYFADLALGDSVLAMKLDHGGHLSHGLKVNFSGRIYHFHSYGLDRETGRLDYDEIERLAQEHRPVLIVAGASAYPRQIDFERFAAIARGVGAKLMVDMAHIAGLIAAGLHPDPVGPSDYVTTTTHKTLAGPRSGVILCKQQYAKSIDKAIFPGLQGGPLMHIIAAKAACFRLAATDEFRERQKRTIANASRLAACLKDGGINLVSGGTDNHLMLADLTNIGITGIEAENRLEEVGITVNKNAVPYDELPPTVTSGIRIGTPAVTTRGFREPEMEQIASIMLATLSPHITADEVKRLRQKTDELLAGFPLYPHL
ncbi:MAG: serine hydroxymethyltransferase [Thermoleophilia bacterium]|nr:serine hydroxymethyltransferase [Thermoleophilia bacterium]